MYCKLWPGLCLDLHWCITHRVFQSWIAEAVDFRPQLSFKEFMVERDRCSCLRFCVICSRTEVTDHLYYPNLFVDLPNVPVVSKFD